MRNKKFLRRIIEILFILVLIVPSQPIYARAGGGGGGGGALSHQVKVVVEKMGPVPLISNLL